MIYWVAMVKLGASRSLILVALSSDKPKGRREIIKETSLDEDVVSINLYRCWKEDLILRTKKPLYESTKIFKGRAGVSRTTRPYHLYVLRPKDIDSLRIGGHEFVKFNERFLDVRGGGTKSKSREVLDFLRKHNKKAWFSKEIVEALRDKGVRACDVMANVRRFERRSLVYVRGYKLDDRQTPFKEGFLIVWIAQGKMREQALEDCIQLTNKVLSERSSENPTIERIHFARDTIIEHSKLRSLVSLPYIQKKLGLNEHEAEYALSRAMQLYPDLKVVKLFNAYRYYYHTSLSDLELQAAIKMKENFIRMTKGRANRIGHNWEAVAEWFIDKFTSGAHFWTQSHRTPQMDSRRITLHLIKSVAGRRNAAEVDRVWEVTPGVFAPSITYVLSCKWGLVRKEDVDDFLEVLRWSKEFGVDTPDGRQIRQGVYGVFAGQAFDPNESVRLKNDSSISLASYVARMNIQLLKAVDFNSKLHERRCPKIVTVQRICRISKNEGEVRQTLDAIWENSAKSVEILEKITQNNEDVFRFERMLENV